MCELSRGVNQATAFTLTPSVCSNHIWDGGCAAVSTDIQQHQSDAQEACSSNGAAAASPAVSECSAALVKDSRGI